MNLRIDSITVKTGRREVNQGKVKELADSISEIGLLNPITVTKDNVLVAGLHRLLAVKSLGRETIEASVIDVDGLHTELAEIDENLIRNELHYIDRGNQLKRRKQIYEELYPGTKVGVAQALAMNKILGHNVSAETAPTFVADTSTKTGKSKRVIHEELQIANNILPEVQKVIKEKDLPKTEALKISRLEPEQQKEVLVRVEQKQANTYRQAINQVRKKEIKPVELPQGKFNVIYADPPWQYDFAETENRAIENQYPSMDLEDIKNTEIPSTDNAVLFLWATAPKLLEAIEVMQAWGFKYKTSAVWDKEKIGMGYWFRGQHELLLVGVKGDFSPPPPENRESSVYREKRTEHSKKPLHYYELIEKMFPDAKYLEMFSRNKYSEKWTVWGNQCE